MIRQAHNEAFCKAHNMIYGDVLDTVKQLRKITFEEEDVEDSLLRMCEFYHLERKDQESFLEIGEYQFNQLENTFYKWTNPFFLVFGTFYLIGVFFRSLFITAKSFKK